MNADDDCDQRVAAKIGNADSCAGGQLLGSHPGLPFGIHFRLAEIKCRFVGALAAIQCV